MTPVILELILITHAAFATDSNIAARACERHASPAPAARPDPFAVDPEDEQAILAFVDQLAPLPFVDTPHGLRDALKVVWKLYRPGLTEAELAARVRIYDSARSAYKILRGTQPSRRVEYGRLRLTWLEFLRELKPGGVPNDRALDHRARALMVNQRAGSVVAFLGSATGAFVGLRVEAVTRAIARLHEQHLPDVLPEPARDVPEDYMSQQTEVRRLWAAYVDALTSYRARAVVSSPTSGLRFKYRREMPRDFRAVPVEPRWIVEFLMLRYPHVKPMEPEALALFLNLLRAEHGLEARAWDLRPREFTNVFHHRYHYSNERLLKAWRQLLEEISDARDLL